MDLDLGGLEPIGADVALTERVRDAIRKAIQDQGLEAGATLPSEIQLAEQLRVSPPTVGKALWMLAQEGVIETRRGARTRVR